MTWKAPNDTLLVLVDIQPDFCPGGKLSVQDGDAVVPVANTLARHFNENAILLTQDWHPKDHTSFADNHPGAAPFSTTRMWYGEQTLWPEHCVQGSAGAEIRGDLKAKGVILQKGTNRKIDSYSGFFENDGVSQPKLPDGRTLTEFARAGGFKRIVFAGLAYDFCVGYSALDARKEGFEAVVVKDGTRSIGIPLGDDASTETNMTRQLIEAGVSIVNARQLPRALAL